jgi:hypothetical protein
MLLRRFPRNLAPDLGLYISEQTAIKGTIINSKNRNEQEPRDNEKTNKQETTSGFEAQEGSQRRHHRHPHREDGEKTSTNPKLTQRDLIEVTA